MKGLAEVGGGHPYSSEFLVEENGGGWCNRGVGGWGGIDFEAR